MKQELLEQLEVRILRAFEDLDHELQAASSYLFRAGGKRIRARILMLSCEAVGGDPAKALDAAAGIEILHGFSLIHDDLIDKAQLRRGVPALHRIYGQEMGILVGDLLFSKAFQLLAKMDFQDGIRRECMEILANACSQMCQGQYLDLVFSRQGKATEDEYLEMVSKKTGELFKAAARIGGLLGGGSREELEILSNFGMDLGIGFQIRDDVLNLISDPRELGKDRGSDLMEGKQTLITIAAADRGLRLENVSPQQLDELIRRLDELGCIQYAESRAREYILRARSWLSKLRPSPARDQLEKIAEDAISRRF